MYSCFCETFNDIQTSRSSNLTWDFHFRRLFLSSFSTWTICSISVPSFQLLKKKTVEGANHYNDVNDAFKDPAKINPLSTTGNTGQQL